MGYLYLRDIEVQQDIECLEDVEECIDLEVGEVFLPPQLLTSLPFQRELVNAIHQHLNSHFDLPFY